LRGRRRVDVVEGANVFQNGLFVGGVHDGTKAEANEIQDIDRRWQAVEFGEIGQHPAADFRFGKSVADGLVEFDQRHRLGPGSGGLVAVQMDFLTSDDLHGNKT